MKEIAKVRAVDDVSFKLNKGETLGIVGESGCGKSTLAQTIIQLEKATSGEILFEGKNIIGLSKREMRGIRKNIQMVFQDPMYSLNPRHTVEDILLEPLEIHKIGKSVQVKRDMVAELLVKVGLKESMMERYPHEFSGGQRQRIGIARAVILKPKLIIADEPVSALDVSVQAQILNLMKRLQKELEITYLFIAHDLSVVKYMSTNIAVMYLGKIVEQGKADELYKNPLHPYTKALISAVPIPDPRIKKERIILEGDVPSPINPPSGCTFHPRCKFVLSHCKVKEPSLLPHNDNPSQTVSCFLYEKS